MRVVYYTWYAFLPQKWKIKHFYSQDLLRELSFQEDQINEIGTRVDQLSEEHYLQTVIVEWDNHIATIKSKVSIVESAIMKKLENAGKIKESEKQFEKDYNELEAWLTEQENEMEVIRKVTVASPSDTSKLLDRCKVYIYVHLFLEFYSRLLM